MCSDRLQARGELDKRPKQKGFFYFYDFYSKAFNSISNECHNRTSKEKINMLEKENSSPDRFDSTPDCALLLHNVSLVLSPGLRLDMLRDENALI